MQCIPCYRVKELQFAATEHRGMRMHTGAIWTMVTILQASLSLNSLHIHITDAIQQNLCLHSMLMLCENRAACAYAYRGNMGDGDNPAGLAVHLVNLVREERVSADGLDRVRVAVDLLHLVVVHARDLQLWKGGGGHRGLTVSAGSVWNETLDAVLRFSRLSRSSSFGVGTWMRFAAAAVQSFWLLFVRSAYETCIGTRVSGPDAELAGTPCTSLRYERVKRDQRVRERTPQMTGFTRT